MHTIRLRGPWTFEVLRVAAGSPAPVVTTGKVTMPCDWGGSLGADFRGTVRYRRVFHRPTGLEPEQAVRLVLDDVRGTYSVRVNSQPLAGLASALNEFSIADLLSDNNELLVEVTHDGGLFPGGLTGHVQLFL